MLDGRRFHLLNGTFLAVLAGGIVLERWVNYLWFEQVVVWGQPANVVTVFLVSGIALWAWLLTRPRGRASGVLLVYLVAMSAAWLVHWLLYRYHGDAMNYTAILYVPILILIAVKPPDSREARLAVLTFAWTTATVLVATRLLEMIGLLAIKPQSPGVIAFDEDRYFLPLNELIGIDGRWPGPFGHNGDTAMMGALLIVIALAFWSRWSWVFLVIGTLTLVLTNGRASIGAAVAGAIVIAMFSRSSRLHWFPRRLRIVAGSVLLAGGALVMFGRPSGLTGRERIWPAFLELWYSSPWIGVGGGGIDNGNELSSIFLHAHSLYIDELARWGLVGFITQFGALGIGLAIAGIVAWRGQAGPLAVLVAYFVTGITEPRNAWISPSATGFLVILMVTCAAAMLKVGSAGSGLDDSPKQSEHLLKEPTLALNSDGQNEQGADGHSRT